jgi:transposase InsO family protein
VDDYYTRIAYVEALSDERGGTCAELGVAHRFTKPGCPWTNDKAERFNQSLLTEFAYRRPWHSHHDRQAAEAGWSCRQHSTRPLRPRGPSTHWTALRMTGNNPRCGR